MGVFSYDACVSLFPPLLLHFCSPHTTTPSGSTPIYRPRYRCGDRVQWRRHGLGSRKYGPCVVDDPRSGLLLFRSLKEKERAFAPLSIGCGDRGHFFRGVLVYISLSCRPLIKFIPQWFFWGYSLAFGETDNGYIGNLKHFALMHVDGQPSMGSPRIPALVFAIYQCMFAVIT